jgi:hypothetical protein
MTNPERSLFPPPDPEELPSPERRLFPVSRTWRSEKARAVPPRSLEADPISRVDCHVCGFWVWCRRSEIAWWFDGHLKIRHGKEEL